MAMCLNQVDGLGSYGSYPIPELGETGDLSDPIFKKMGYKVPGHFPLSDRFTK